MLVESFGFVRLYLDDVEDLLRLVRARSHSVVLAARNAVADEAEDLRGATVDELKEVALRVSEPDLTIWIQRSRARVETSDDSDAAKALVADIVALLRMRPDRRGIPFLRAFAASSVLLVATIVALLSIHFSTGLNAANPWPILAFGGTITSFTLWIALVNRSANRNQGSARIIPEFRREARANSGNRQIVWATVAAAIAGAALSAVLTRVLSSL